MRALGVFLTGVALWRMVVTLSRYDPAAGAPHELAGGLAFIALVAGLGARMLFRRGSRPAG
jgi:hypothetical protein